MTTRVRLVDGAREMVLAPREDIAMQSLDLGWPAPVAEAEQRTDDDGENDTTTYFGARVVALEMYLLDTPLALLDELRTFSRPGSRPYLHVYEPEWGAERRLRLRAEDQRAVRGGGLPLDAGALPVQTQWRAPEGVIEAVTEASTTLAVSGEPTGLALPTITPVTLTATRTKAAATVSVAGTLPVHWTARLYGPCTTPRFTRTDSGETLAWPNLVLAAGEYLEVNSRARSVYLNGDRTKPRLRELDFQNARWWRLHPGANAVMFHPQSLGPGAAAQMTWRAAWL